MDQSDDLGEEEVPWLREMVDDELLGLFSEEEDEVRRTARNLGLRASSDTAVLEKLVDALRTSIERQNDDTRASLWIALILGEIGDPTTTPILLMALGSGDEPLQEASRDAILRMGAPAIEALMDEIDEEPGPELTDAGYRLLGYVGSLGDPQLLERVMDFLLGQVDREAAKPPDERRIESLFHAGALLGDRRMLKPMDLVLRERFQGRNAAIRDSREMLAENTAGEPLVYDSPPWIQEHRWLFEGSSRVRRGGPDQEDDAEEEDGEEGEGEVGMEMEAFLGEGGGPAVEEEEAGEDESLSAYFWGMSATAERRGRSPLDARRFLPKPGEAEGGEEHGPPADASSLEEDLESAEEEEDEEGFVEGEDSDPDEDEEDEEEGEGGTGRRAGDDADR